MCVTGSVCKERASVFYIYNCEQEFVKRFLSGKSVYVFGKVCLKYVNGNICVYFHLM